MAELSALNVLIEGDASGLKSAIASSVGLVDKFKKSASDSAKVFEREFAKAEKSADRLRASLDPLYAASKRYERVVNQLNSQVKQGITTQAEANRLTDLAAQKYLAAGNAAQVMGAQVQTAGNYTANIAAQFNDIGVMLAAGQSPLMLAVQQGTQLNQVFAQMGSGRAVLSGLAQGFMSMVNPMSLATIGIIAGGAALVQWGVDAIKAEEDTIGFKEAVAALNEEIAENADRLEMLRAGLDSINQLNVQRQINALMQSRRELLADMDGMNNRQLRNARAELAIIDQQVAELKAKLEESKRVNVELELAEQNIFGIISALQQVDFSPLISQAKTFANILGEAAQNAWNMANARVAIESGQMDLEFGAQAYGGAQEAMRNAMQQFRESGTVLPAAKTKGGGSKGGGGGKGGGGANPIVAELDALRQALMSQEELQIQSYTRQQETLRSALEQRLITQQEYAAMMEDAQQQHADRMAEIDVYRYGDTLQKTGAFMGDMAAALQSGNEKMQKIAQGFAATEALINAWRAYNQVLAQPDLSFAAKMAKASAVLAAGMGAVSAIKGAGSGGSSGSSSGSSSAAQTASPLLVSLQGVEANTLYRGSDISALFDQLSDEAGDRGLTFARA